MTTTEAAISSDGKAPKVTKAPKAPTPKLDEAMAASVAEGQAAMRQAIETTVSRRVPLGQVDESPFNKRRTWGSIDELAKTFLEVGILQDLVGRPHPTKAGRIELVFGARRLRGAARATLDAVPMKVLELTDAQVVELIAIENLQREDIHPIEEAETFEQLRLKQFLSVDELALKVGKSKAYVYARLKYLDLCSAARKAFVDGDVTASVALLIARIPHEKLQLEALKELTSRHGDVDPTGTREAFRVVSHRFMLRLVEAPFDCGDATLVQNAGACTTCPKRSGNQPELFADVVADSKDVCTDPVCFKEKKEAHIAREKARFQEKGVELLEGKPQTWGDGVSLPAGYEKLSEHNHDWQNKKIDGKTNAQILKGAGIVRSNRTVMLDAKGNTIELVATTLVSQAKAKLGKKPEPRAKPTTPEQKARELARDEIEDETIKAVVSAVERRGITDELVRVFIGHVGEPDKMKKLVGKALAAYGAQCLLNDYPEDGERLAKAYDVDLKAIEKRVLAAKASPASVPAKGIAAAAKAAKKAASSKGRKK